MLPHPSLYKPGTKGILSQLAGRLPKQLDFIVDEELGKSRTTNAVVP